MRQARVQGGWERARERKKGRKEGSNALLLPIFWAIDNETTNNMYRCFFLFYLLNPKYLIKLCQMFCHKNLSYFILLFCRLIWCAKMLTRLNDSYDDKCALYIKNKSSENIFHFQVKFNCSKTNLKCIKTIRANFPSTFSD